MRCRRERRSRRCPHDRLRESGRRHRRRRGVRGGLCGDHTGADAAGGVGVLPVVPRRAGAGAVLRRSPSSGSSARSCCSATASIRSGLLVPFLIFAIGVSHGVQKISAVSDAVLAGLDSMEAARRTFRQLLVPAIVALLADLVGFVTILLIPVQVIREMAITASIGVAIVILTDLVLLPVLVSYVQFDDGIPRARRTAAASARAPCGTGLRASRSAGRRSSSSSIAVAARRFGRVEGPRDADRRYAGRRSGAAAGLALQPRQQHHHLRSSRSASTSSR